jgi:hypothetical protein
LREGGREWGGGGKGGRKEDGERGRGIEGKGEEREGGRAWESRAKRRVPGWCIEYKHNPSKRPFCPRVAVPLFFSCCCFDHNYD